MDGRKEGRKEGGKEIHTRSHLCDFQFLIVVGIIEVKEGTRAEVADHRRVVQRMVIQYDCRLEKEILVPYMYHGLHVPWLLCSK